MKHVLHSSIHTSLNRHQKVSAPPAASTATAQTDWSFHQHLALNELEDGGKREKRSKKKDKGTSYKERERRASLGKVQTQFDLNLEDISEMWKNNTSAQCHN